MILGPPKCRGQSDCLTLWPALLHPTFLTQEFIYLENDREQSSTWPALGPTELLLKICGTLLLYAALYRGHEIIRQLSVQEAYKLRFDEGNQ